MIIFYRLFIVKYFIKIKWIFMYKAIYLIIRIKQVLDKVIFMNFYIILWKYMKIFIINERF
jgi:hypothetical protein